MTDYGYYGYTGGWSYSTTSASYSEDWCKGWTPYDPDPALWAYDPRLEQEQPSDKGKSKLLEIPASDNPCEIDDFLKNFKII